MSIKGHVNLIKQRVRKQFSSVAAPVICYFNGIRFDCIAPVNKTIWIKIEDVFGWYRGDRYNQFTYQGQIRGGDWSGKITKSEQMLNNSFKYEAVIQRFEHGEMWGNTRLFTKRHAKDYQKRKKIHGMSNMEELEKYYEKRYDSLFRKIKENGILPATEENPRIAPIYIHINKNGEFLYTVDGNHRLAMCKVLGIKKIPVQVWMRHKEWQQKREIMLGGDANSEEKRVLLEKYKHHPDIVSELNQAKSIGFDEPEYNNTTRLSVETIN